MKAGTGVELFGGKGKAGKRAILALAMFAVFAAATPRSGLVSRVLGSTMTEEKKKLSHEETLRWIVDHKAWKEAKKTKPIFARKVRSDEVDKEFKTADHSVEKAREGYWLCVGVAGEPWFQSLDKIEEKYKHAGDKDRKFDFDTSSREYREYVPRAEVRSLVAQVKGDEIAGFYIKPNYDPKNPLYSPAGGYVVTDYVADPYKAPMKDVWLVQEKLFESTYEIVR